MAESERTPELGAATWVSATRPLAAWVHRPASGRSHGAVIIAPPFGRERMTSYRALRHVAITLAQRGWVAVRFTWSGFGESAPLDPDAAPSNVWRADLAAVAELACAASGHTAVDAIGLRLGASVLAGAAVELRTRLLWEPISGRAFLRRQAALLKLGADAELLDRGVETPAEFFQAPVAEALRAIPDARKLEPALLPPGSRLVLESDPGEAREIAQSDHDIVVSAESVERLIAALPSDRAERASPDWQPQLRAALREPETGRQVVETLVSIGPHRLPGTITQPLDGSAPGGAVFLQPASNEAKGVTTMWPALARNLAARGVTVLRADRRTSGDGEPAGTLEDSVPVSDAAIDDIVTAARWLASESGAPVTGVGLCMGGWTLGRAAEAGAVARIVGFNQRIWTRRRVVLSRQLLLSPPAVRGGQRGVPAPEGAGGGASVRLKLALRRWARAQRARALGAEPLAVRNALAALGVVESAWEVLSPAARRATIEVYNSVEDGELFIRAYGPQALARLRRRGRHVTARVEPGLDHALLSEGGRRRVFELTAAALGLADEPAAASAAAEDPSEVGVLEPLGG